MSTKPEYLTQSDYNVLVCLSLASGYLTIEELSQRTGHNAHGVRQGTRKLLIRELVRSQRDSGDGRALLWAATERGRCVNTDMVRAALIAQIVKTPTVLKRLSISYAIVVARILAARADSVDTWKTGS